MAKIVHDQLPTVDEPTLLLPTVAPPHPMARSHGNHVGMATA